MASTYLHTHTYHTQTPTTHPPYTHINTYIIHIYTHTTYIHTTHIDTHNTYTYEHTHKCTYSHTHLYRYTKHIRITHRCTHALTHTHLYTQKEREERKESKRKEWQERDVKITRQRETHELVIQEGQEHPASARDQLRPSLYSQPHGGLIHKTVFMMEVIVTAVTAMQCADKKRQLTTLKD